MLIRNAVERLAKYQGQIDEVQIKAGLLIISIVFDTSLKYVLELWYAETGIRYSESDVIGDQKHAN